MGLGNEIGLGMEVGDSGGLLVIISASECDP